MVPNALSTYTKLSPLFQSSHNSKTDLNIPHSTKTLLTYPVSSNAQPSPDYTRPRSLTAVQRDARRAQDLCYYFVDKYAHGHQCRQTKTFMIVGESQEEIDCDTAPKYDEDP